MAKVYIIKNPKKKDAQDIGVDANTSADDFAAFADAGYEVAVVQKQIVADAKA